MFFDEAEKALSLPVRKKIYDIVAENPGLHFREIQRRTNLAVGNLQYHLEFLEKKHLIKTQRDGKFLRYYSVRGIQVEEKDLMALLRKKTIRKIVLFLLNNSIANNLQIAKALQLSPSTTSWHLNKLLTQNVIEKKIKGRKTYYSLKNPEQVKQLILGFKKSFLDNLIDSFAELWEEEI
jgi:predicted transcriptional regulator